MILICQEADGDGQTESDDLGADDYADDPRGAGAYGSGDGKDDGS